jgi:hypothetical protein
MVTDCTNAGTVKRLMCGKHKSRPFAKGLPRILGMYSPGNGILGLWTTNNLGMWRTGPVQEVSKYISAFRSTPATFQLVKWGIPGGHRLHTAHVVYLVATSYSPSHSTLGLRTKESFSRPALAAKGMLEVLVRDAFQ